MCSPVIDYLTAHSHTQTAKFCKLSFQHASPNLPLSPPDNGHRPRVLSFIASRNYFAVPTNFARSGHGDLLNTDLSLSVPHDTFPRNFLLHLRSTHRPRGLRNLAQTISSVTSPEARANLDSPGSRERAGFSPGLGPPHRAGPYHSDLRVHDGPSGIPPPHKALAQRSHREH